MRIAQIAPLVESVPPRLYGGTERVISYLTEELVGLGHEVTLFASGDSATAAKLVACAPRAARLDPGVRDPLPYAVMMLERVRRLAGRFDVLHFHIEHLHLPLFRAIGRKTLTTLHGRLDLPGLSELYAAFPGLALAAISDSQRGQLPNANWAGTVHHGLPPDLYPPRTEVASAEPYFAFLGRVSPEKGLERAIEIARRAGRRLRIAAKIDDQDERYWRERIAPLIAPPQVEFVGEVDERAKPGFLAGAAALLFPINWPEPFGLVMIEAMSCGTPVIAWPHGAVPEILEHGSSGFIVDSIEAAVDAARRVGELDRRRVRERFEQRFTAAHMARRYVDLYHALAARTAAQVVA